MNPNYTHTITLFHCLKAVDNLKDKKDRWFRTVLQGCFYKAQIGRTESGKELGMSNVYTVRIPENIKYLPAVQWKNLSEEELEEFFTVEVDDIVIYGMSEDEISGMPGNTAAEVLRRNKPGAFRVTAFSDNTKFAASRHYRLGG